MAGQLAGEFAGRIPPPVRRPHRLAGLVVGDLVPPSWARHAGGLEATGFFALKGAVNLAGQLGAAVSVGAGSEPFLHPGRAAALAVAETEIGWLGELHPLIARAWDLPSGTAFELDLAPLVAAGAARAIPRPDHVPGGAPGSRGGRQRGRAGGRVRGPSALAAASCWWRPTCSTSTASELRRGPQEPHDAAPEFHAPGRHHRRGGRRPARADRSELRGHRGIAA